MRLHFDGVRRPARVAKLLRAELANLSITIGLGGAQDVTARAFGYAHYKELQALVGTQAASPWDEACDAEEVGKRRRRQAEAFRQAGLTPAQASDLVERLRPSGRKLGTEARPSRDEESEYDRLRVPAGLVTGPDGWNVIADEEYQTILRLPSNALRAAYRAHMVALPNGWLVASPAFFEEDITETMRLLVDFGYHVERRIVVTASLISTLHERANKEIGLESPEENPFLGEARKSWLAGETLYRLSRSIACPLPEAHSRHLAILADGKLLLDVDHADAPRTVWARLRACEGMTITEVILVPPQVIAAFRSTVATNVLNDLRIGNPGARKVLSDLFAYAVNIRASEISLTYGTDGVSAHARIDGVNTRVDDFEVMEAGVLMGEAHQLCEGMNSSYKPHEPQRGRMTSLGGFLPEALQAASLEWAPTSGSGRHMTVRLYYAQGAAGRNDEGLEDLGYTPEQARLIRRMMRRPSGLNIVSGPADSGKSRTLQVLLGAGLRDATAGRKVTTVEEVTSCMIPGAHQIEVQHHGTEPERMQAFQAAIHAGLRSSPDILMIGEIKEHHAARLAFQGASAGLQVWTTTQSNDALGTLDNLRTLGIEGFRAYDHTLVGGLIAQKLVRGTCPECSLGYAEALKAGVTDDEMGETLVRLIGESALSTSVRFANPDGCGHCRSGHKGRVLVAEVVVPTREMMKRMEVSGKQAARDCWIEDAHGVPMMMHALMLIARGILDPNEVETRVGLLDEVDANHCGLVMQRAMEAA